MPGSGLASQASVMFAAEVKRGVSAKKAPQSAIRAENLTRVADGTTYNIQRPHFAHEDCQVESRPARKSLAQNWDRELRTSLSFSPVEFSGLFHSLKEFARSPAAFANRRLRQVSWRRAERFLP